MPMMMFAAGPMPVLRLVGMIMGVRMTVAMSGVIVPVTVMIMAMVVMVMMTVAVIVPAIMLVYALRLEGAHDARRGAPLSTNEFGESGIVLDIERLCRHFRCRMTVADLIRDPHQAKGIPGLDLQERLERGLDSDEASILELHGIAILQRRGLV